MSTWPPPPNPTNPFPFDLTPEELARLEPLGTEPFFLSDLLADFDYRPPDKPALGVGALLVGPRRCGKTAMLSLIAENARWTQVVVTTTAREGEPLDVTLAGAFRAAGERMTKWIAESDDEDVQQEDDWLADFVAAHSSLGGYELVEQVGKEGKERGRGLVLCIDDLHNASAEEMERLGETIRVLIRDERVPIYLRAAGLGRVRHNLGARAWRYLLRRRGKGQHLPLGDALEIERNFSRRLLMHGASSTTEAALELARSMEGSPYLFHLIAHHAWEVSEAPEKQIELADVDRAVELARPIYVREVSEPTWAERDEIERAVVLTIYEHDARREDYRLYSKRTLAEYLGGEDGEYDEDDVKAAVDRLLLEDVIYEFPSPDGSLGLWVDNGLPPWFLATQLAAA